MAAEKNEKDKTQRRVYVLPNDLVERILEFQKDNGFASEVEAARRLLDEALMRRDDWRAITLRFLERLKETKVLADIAKDVLMGHPLVRQVKWDNNQIEFETVQGERVTVNRDGTSTAFDGDGDGLQLNPKPVDYGRRSAAPSRDLDDEIPF